MSQNPSRKTFDYQKLTEIFCSQDNAIRWIHTDPFLMKWLLIEEIAPLYQKIVKKDYPSSQNAELFQDVGRFHWLMAHAAPFTRGSAAITENLTRAILLSKGRVLLPYQDGILPDLEALTEPDVDQFSKNYIELFTNSHKERPEDSPVK